MRLRPALLGAPLVLALAATFSLDAHALPPGAARRGFVDGANHHLGDAALLSPTSPSNVVRAESSVAGNVDEATRMHAHLVYVRALLASRPPTRPALAARRASLLAALDEYIARGITPKNRHLPWRTPVFIDDDGSICAVGYLIERTAGRPLAEAIAAAHRYDFLEDIAAAMPEVRAWIEASGFTLDELASIQPGYERPFVATWSAGHVEDADERVSGALVDGKMNGVWTMRDVEGHVVGSGTFVEGAGSWTSRRADGSKLAEGAMIGNAPEGRWRFFHASGAIAAEGSFASGRRDGAWTFYYDGDPSAKTPTRIAAGAFDHGAVVGTWHHHDARGALLATSRDLPQTRWNTVEHFLSIVPRDGVAHWVNDGDIDAMEHRLDLFFDGHEPIYVQSTTYGDEATIYDAEGNRLEATADGWRSSNCGWPASWKKSARVGDVVTLNADLAAHRYDPTSTCKPAQIVPAWRAKRLDHELASVALVAAVRPEIVRRIAAGDADVDERDATIAAEAKRLHARADALAASLASSMSWYVEWPHVDGLFVDVFATIPGYRER